MKSEISINALRDPKRRKENEIKSFESISLCLISYFFVLCVEIDRDVESDPSGRGE
jgi:hypothetical protein